MVVIARSHMFNVHDDAQVLGFGFVEFATPEPKALGQMFRHLGFVFAGRHPDRPIELYRQGHIVFVVNADPDGGAGAFAQTHGPSVSGFSFYFEDADTAWETALTRGAEPIESEQPLDFPAVTGVGGSRLYMVDRNQWAKAMDKHFELLIDPGAVTPGFGLQLVDHLTHNVKRGDVDPWAEFYEQVFNFEEQRFFEIHGEKTGLRSRAMVDPTNIVRIPINESLDDNSQIEEFIRDYHGEGVQHIALSTNDIYATVEAMRAQGVEFLDVPDTYYEVLDERVPGHGEDVDRLRHNSILLDRAPRDGKGVLLQIFTQPLLGPVFFEIIERKGNAGFGDANFQALFEAIERDQIRRGVL